MSNRRFTAALVVLSVLFATPVTAKEIQESIYIVSLVRVDGKVIQKIKEALPQALPVPARASIDPALEMPEAAYDASRKQYDAGIALDILSRRITLTPVNERALIVTDNDLYAQGMSFVFGAADPKKGTAIISLARLKNEFYGLKPDNKLFMERVIKEALHELGHSWGIEHCPNPKCAMYSSNTLADTDKKRGSFCHSCKNKLVNREASPIFKMPSL